MTGDEISRQIRVSQLEAGFSLVCTLVVCVHQEFGSFPGTASAVAIPVAMAFSVHGLNNAKGLGLWNWLYLPTRVVVIVLGVAYSYQHYYHFLPPLNVAGRDLRPAVALIMELLTLSALIAHQGHNNRLRTTTPKTTTTTDDDGGIEAPPTEPEPTVPVIVTPSATSVSAAVPESVSLFIPPTNEVKPLEFINSKANNINDIDHLDSTNNPENEYV